MTLPRVNALKKVAQPCLGATKAATLTARRGTT
ncbi:hypothetical protein shim_00380 [Shimia sp. SK013]|nr:hypothetical protein shim_00380 [Shimia sp. SK013]